jgi:pimeloyl-ACP methyl ester carboxylesterase
VPDQAIDYRADLRSALQTLAEQASDPLLRRHFDSILQVVEAGDRRTAADDIPYLAYPCSHPGTSYAFEDGYLVSPWGRGNLWCRGISETDIWEGRAAVMALVRVNESRQYLCGHSMGGYGAWHIAHRSAGTWAALGIHAGALGFETSELDASVATALRDLPTYFVVGTSDSLLGVNQAAYVLLQDAGNPNLAFVTFPGGHDYRQSDVEAMYLWLRTFELRR